MTRFFSSEDVFDLRLSPSPLDQHRLVKARGPHSWQERRHDISIPSWVALFNPVMCPLSLVRFL